MSDGFNLLPQAFAAQQQHLANSQQPQRAPAAHGVPTPQDAQLWNSLEHQFQNSLSSNPTPQQQQQMLYHQQQQQAQQQAQQAQQQLLQQQLQNNQASAAGLYNAQLRMNQAAAAAAAQQGLGGGGAQPGGQPNGGQQVRGVSANGQPFNLPQGMLPNQFDSQINAFRAQAQQDLIRQQQQQQAQQQQQGFSGAPNQGMMGANAAPPQPPVPQPPQPPNAGLLAMAQLQRQQQQQQAQAQAQAQAQQQAQQQQTGGPAASQFNSTATAMMNAGMRTAGGAQQQMNLLLQHQKRQEMQAQASLQSIQAQQHLQMQQRQLAGFPGAGTPQQQQQQQAQAQAQAAQQQQQQAQQQQIQTEVTRQKATMELQNRIMMMTPDELREKMETLKQKLTDAIEQERQLRDRGAPQETIARVVQAQDGIKAAFGTMYKTLQLKTQGGMPQQSQPSQQQGDGGSSNQTGMPDPRAQQQQQQQAWLAAQQQQHQQQAAQDQQQQQHATMQAQATTFLQQQQQQQAIQNQQAQAAHAAQTAQGGQMVQRTPSAAPGPQSSPPMPPGGGDTTQRWDGAFKQLFGQWITGRNLKFEQPFIDGKPVDLSKLFLTVGALGGMKKVTEDNAWPIIGGFVGFPYQSVPGRQVALSHPETSLKLKNIYQATLADFQEHWYNSFRSKDEPGVSIPLPPPLQFLRPTINELARRALSRQDTGVQQGQQGQGQGQGPRGPTPVQQQQNQSQIPHSVQQQQRLLMGAQTTIAPPPPAVGQRPPFMNLNPQQLQQLMNMSVDQMKAAGLKDEQIQLIQQQQSEKMRLLQQQRVNMAQAQNAAAVAQMNGQQQQQQLLANNMHSAMGGRPPSSLGMPPDHQQLQSAPGMGLGRTPTPAALPPSLANLRTGHSPQEIMDSRTYVHSLMVAIQNQRGRSPAVNLPVEHQRGIESKIEDWKTLIRQAQGNLPIFHLLRPRESQRLIQIAGIVTILAEQITLLEGPPEQKQFILQLQDSQNLIQELINFIISLKNLQSQMQAGMAMQPTQSNPPPPPPPMMANMGQPPMARPPTADIAQPPGYQPQVTPQMQNRPAPQQPPTHTKAPSISKARKLTAGGPVSSPSPAAQAPTPANTGSPSAPKSPANSTKPAPKSTKAAAKQPKGPTPKRRPSKSTPKLSAAQVPAATPKPEPERPTSKRGRDEEGETDTSSPKRPRTNPQDELDVKREEDVAKAGTSVESAIGFAEDSVKRYEATVQETSGGDPIKLQQDTSVLQDLLRALADGDFSNPPSLTAPLTAKEEPGVDAPIKEDELDAFAWLIDSTQFPDDVGETPELVPSVSSQGPTPNSDHGEADTNAGAQTARVEKELSGISGVNIATESYDFWTAIEAPEARFHNDDGGWKSWDGDLKSNGEWPIIPAMSSGST